VAGALLVLVLLVSYACGGSSGSSSAGQRTAGTPTTVDQLASGTPSPSPSVQRPETGEPSPAASPAAVAPASTATSPAPAPVASTSEVCTDEEMQLTPSVQKIVNGTFAYEFVLKIRNLSNHTCKRDIGPEPQELRITSNGQTLWSTDSCPNAHGPADVRVFGPGIETTFRFGWDGTVGTTCSGGRRLEAGDYQIVARLDNKSSAPVTFTMPPTGK
jgi:hypothetical protein